MKQKTLKQKINGWLPKEPSDFKVALSNPMLRSTGPVDLRQLRVGFVFLGLFLWGFAGFLLSFTQFGGGLGGQPSTVTNSYWIEIVVLFVSGIAAVSFAAVYKKTKEIKKRGTALIVLVTSILGLFLFWTLAVPIEELHMPVFNQPAFGMLIMFDGLIAALVTFAIFHITHYYPWDRLKPQNLRNR
jgi:hypothetical protein